MKTFDLIVEMQSGLSTYLPLSAREKFALFIGGDRYVDLLSDTRLSCGPFNGPKGHYPQLEIVNRESIALSAADPSWADGGNGHGFGAVARVIGFFVFKHPDPKACHFELMERL